MPVKAEAPTDFRIGEKVPGTNWTVRGVLGRGGMGVVLDVEKELGGLRMAMKVVRPAFAQSEEFIARFLEEVRLLAQLRHPNIVEVTDCDRLADGTPYIMMERLEGRTLREALSDKDIVLSAENVWKIVGELCGALHCAHSAQPAIVHRDVKPGNVFLYDRKHFVSSVKLIDFGISAIVDEKRAKGAPMGTARYMAPEACRGEAPTPQIDIYAAAIIAYEMLTRTWPWDIEKRSAEAMIHAHLNLEPTPPSKRLPWIPKSVDACLLQALQKDPTRRQRDVRDLVAQLGELPFVDDGSGNHRNEGVTAPTAETLAYGRRGRGTRETPEPVPSASSPASVYVSARFDDTSNAPSRSDSSATGRSEPPSSGVGQAGAPDPVTAREETFPTPLSSASEPRPRRRSLTPQIAVMLLAITGLGVSVATYRRTRVSPGGPVSTTSNATPRAPVAGRDVDVDRSGLVEEPATSPATPAVQTAPQEDGGPPGPDRMRSVVSMTPAALPKKGLSRAAPASPGGGARESAPEAAKTKRPLSDEELLFIPGAKR